MQWTGRYADDAFAGRDIPGDNGAGSGDGSDRRSFNRSDQHRVAADEDVCADVGPMLADAIVIAGDDTRTDVGALPNRPASPRYPKWPMRTSARKRAVFDFGEVADMHVRADITAAANVTERSNVRDPAMMTNRRSSDALIAATCRRLLALVENRVWADIAA